MITKTANREAPLLSGDRPLSDPNEDLFGHAPFANALAKSIGRECPVEGLVVGLYGAWGSGKSSTLNFLEQRLREQAEDEDDAPVVLHFNPWWFRGQEELLKAFFSLFEGAVFRARSRARRLRQKLASFGAVMGAAVSELGVPGGKALGKAVEKAAASGELADVAKLKAELVVELRKIALKVVVVIDDIDRLAFDEIRLVLRLVKAVADFPNVTYVLSFDPDVVARALAAAHPDQGAQYIEKIVQVPFDLPIPSSEQLGAMLLRRLDAVLPESAKDAFLGPRWGTVFTRAVRPLLQTPRDVVRVCNAVGVTYPAVHGEVNAVDFVALEALRVLAPSVYRVVRDNSDQFTGSVIGGLTVEEQRKQAREFHDAWLRGASKPEVLKTALRQLFPRLDAVWSNAQSSSVGWARDLRVCSPDIFPVYFRLSVPATSISRRDFLTALDDPTGFGPRLLALAEIRRFDGMTKARVFMEHLESFLADGGGRNVKNNDVLGLLNGLLGVADALVVKEGPRRGLDFGLRPTLEHVLIAFVQQLPENDRLPILLESAKSSESPVTVGNMVVHFSGEHGRHGADARLEPRTLSVESAIQLEKEFAERSASLAEHDEIWDTALPIRLIYLWSFFDSSGVRGWVRALDDVHFLRFLELFASEVIGAGGEPTRYGFDFDGLGVFIDESLARERAVQALSTLDSTELKARPKLGAIRQTLEHGNSSSRGN